MRASRCLLALLVLTVWGGAAVADDVLADWTATAVESFDREPFTVTGPPDAAVRRDFTRFRLARCADARVSGTSARWQLQPHEGVTEAALRVNTTAPADGFAVWIKNPLEHAVQLSLRLTDDAGRTFTTQPRGLGLQKNWFRYVFGLDEFLAADPPPQLPYRTVELVLSALPPAAETTLYLDELCALQAPPPHLTVTDLSAPAEVTAGHIATIRAGVEATPPLLRPVSLSVSLSRSGMPVATRQLTLAPRQSRLEMALAVPRHIAGGPYQLKLAAPGHDLSGEVARTLTVQAGPAPTAIEVRPAAQGGCFVVDGVGLPVLGGWWRAETLPQQTAWLMLNVTSDFDYTGHSAPVWLGPDKFDYSQVHARLAAALGANPDAYLIPIIAISSPPWWDAQHPGELMVFGDGKPRLPASVQAAKHTFASWASAAWRRDAGAALTRLIQHLENSPWGPAIIGYQLASGEDGRWAYPGASDGAFADYSAPQQEAFRAWLKAKYGDVAVLRMAWGQPRSPLGSAEALKELQPIMGWSQVRVPSQARRSRSPSGVLLDPSGVQDVVDYQIFCSDQVVDTIRALATVAREATGRKKLVGVAYGHPFDLAATRCGLQNGGHLALSPVCSAEELDFIASPGTFGESANPPLATTVAASIAQHGKLWVAQGDAGRSEAAVTNAAMWGGVAAVEAPPQAAWVQRLAALPPTMPRSGPAEIAVVVDDISAAYTACGSELTKPLLSDQRLGLALMGAPYDVWTLDDVLNGLAVGYRMYVFLDAFYLDGEARKQLLSALSAQKCTAVWVYAPGALDTGMNSRTIKELTGLTLARPLRPIEGAVKADEADGPAPRTDRGPLQVKLAGPDRVIYGSTLPVSPRFACVDDQADIRGTLVGTDYGGLAVLERSGVKSVWSAAPHLPASLLRSIALDADVHLFSEGATGVYANRNLLAIRAAADGEQHVRLPRPADVFDLATGRPVGATASTDFAVRMKAGEIRFYYWGAAPLAAP
ncbi:beta-galactosidase [bacterium]|nr:beta-galactosidase [bacterium]